MKRDRRTLAETWMDLERSLLDLWLAFLHALGLHTRAELAAKERQAQSYAREAAHAFAQKREVERLLVLLSEPLKDWDLADFPHWADSQNTGGAWTMYADDCRHLREVIAAYRLTASAVAPLRMGRVVDDKMKRRGWDDQPLAEMFLADLMGPSTLPPTRRTLP
jgi:hypothetical protein